MSSSNYLLHLAERSGNLALAYDLSTGQFKYMNPACFSFFGLESEVTEAGLLFSKVHPDDQEYVLDKLNACIDGKIIDGVECRFTRGKYQRWLRITPHLILENDEKILLLEAQDITEYKTQLELLNNHNIKKNSILTILAHDLAGPLGIIQNLSKLLGQETLQLQNGKVDRYINMITKISKSSIELIQNFLNQEFLESADVNLFKKRIELVKKITLGTEEFLAMQEELRINFSCRASADTIYAEIDEDKFMQVINNLISNSLKFTPAGGKIEVNIKENDKDILVTVSDNGIGIPEKFHATLFDKFTEARRTGLQGERSTGLGMSIIKTIIEWHNGEIWFESKENEGTTFYLTLPKYE